MEGDNVYVYKVDKENTVKKIEVEIGLRNQGFIEIKTGLENGDTVVAEGLRKTRPNGKIKPIKYGEKPVSSNWKKKATPKKDSPKKNSSDWKKLLKISEWKKLMNIFNKPELKKKENKS
jgi:membrane fusion protein (multidrug efflux system)